MKKYILILMLSFVLTSCFWEQTKTATVEDLKWEILGKTGTTRSKGKTNTSTEKRQETNTWKEEVLETKEKTSLSVKSLTEEKFLEFDNFPASDFNTLAKEITGKTLTQVDKIVVSHSNPDSKFKDNTFTLKKFKKGDKTFLYRAFKKYENLDYGKNIYTFEAHSGGKISKLELVVTLIEEKKEPVDIANLPEGAEFWSPREIGDGKITYTDIKGLEIENVGEIDLKLDPDSITNYVKNKTKTWFYWNSSKYTSGEKWVSVYVIQKVPEKKEYLYSKHYYNGNGLYGVVELEIGELELEKDDDVSEKLKEKNKELAKKNDTFTITKVTDTLFKKITQ